MAPASVPTLFPVLGRDLGGAGRGPGGRAETANGKEGAPPALPAQTQQSKFLTWQFDGEYRGGDYTATLTLGNPDLIGESGEGPARPFDPGVWKQLGGGRGGEGFSATDCTSPTPVIVVAHFLQSLTQRLVLGGELVYHRRPGEEGAILTLAGKYSSAEEWGQGRSWAGDLAREPPRPLLR